MTNSTPRVRLRFIFEENKLKKIELEPSPEGFACSFDGGSPQDVDIDLAHLPPFTQQVLEAIQTIPIGQTITYSELAAKAGRPRAIRAAASACGRNPFPFLIPCHRVVAKDGIGGFAYPITIKQELLAHEKEFALKLNLELN